MAVEGAESSHSWLPFDAPARARHREWVRRMAAGDADALQLLYLEFSSTINGVVRRILEDPEDARETVQDTFIKAWRNARSYDGERGEVVSWLVFIARHAAIDRVRKGARRRVIYDRLRRESDESPTADPVRPDVREDVERRLGALSPPQRRALELAFFRGCTQAEIAEAMQTPVGNVKNHLKRGLQKLRDLARRT
jgi:RNA polymerase sigma-70 factor (ECF subfamily)